MLLDFTTEKGTVSVKVRSALKAETVKMIKERLGVEVIDSPKGLAIRLGTDARTGNDVFAVIDPTVTMSLEVKDKKSKTAKAIVENAVPNLFE